MGVGVGHAAPGESRRRLPGAPNTDKSRGRERERKATRVGSGNKGEQSGEEGGGKEGQMGRGRKEREMGKERRGDSLPSARLGKQ